MAESNRKRQSTPKNTGKSTRGAGTSRKGGSGAKRGQGKSANTEQDMGFLRAEVVIICSFAVAILLFLSNFKLCGVVGDVLRGVQLGIFGMVGYLLPILIFVGTCFHLSNQGNLHAAMKLAAVVAAVLVVCGLLQLFFAVQLRFLFLFFLFQRLVVGKKVQLFKGRLLRGRALLSHVAGRDIDPADQQVMVDDPVV